jgi:patatin-like phospholipase/acyl hydrolase
MINRLLAIDGGGMRGLYAAHVLERIAAEFSIVYHRDFDLIAGTSTGSIIAGALAFDIPLSKVSSLYRDCGPEIFCNRPWSIGGMLTPKYSMEPLRSALKKVFSDATLKDAKTKLLIPATDIANGTVHVFKSAYDPNFVRDSNVSVVDAIVASCSAPLFFAPAKTGYYLLCDGGLWANNPSLVVVTEALSRLEIDRRSIRLLSVGTGTGRNYYPLGSRSWLWGFVAGWGMKKFIYMLLNLQSATATNVTKLLLDDRQIVRVNFESDRPLPLDDPSIIDDMITRADHDFSHSSARIRAWLQDFSRTL